MLDYYHRQKRKKLNTFYHGEWGADSASNIALRHPIFWCAFDKVLYVALDAPFEILNT